MPKEDKPTMGAKNIPQISQHFSNLILSALTSLARSFEVVFALWWYFVKNKGYVDGILLLMEGEGICVCEENTPIAQNMQRYH